IWTLTSSKTRAVTASAFLWGWQSPGSAAKALGQIARGPATRSAAIDVMRNFLQDSVAFLPVKPTWRPRSPIRGGFRESHTQRKRTSSCIRSPLPFRTPTARLPDLRLYLSYYHKSHLHLSLDKDSPDPRPIQSSAKL